MNSKVFYIAFAIGSFVGTALTAFAKQPIPTESLERALLETRQQYGQTMLDKSVDGNPLKIAGRSFESGIGTHATSMIPLDVLGSEFSGTVGIDDEAKDIGDGVEFRIIGARKILWTSGFLKKGTAKNFNISIPKGTHRVYLMTVAGRNNFNDHADWVNLEWNGTVREKPSKPVIVTGKTFGLTPGTKDATRQLCDALEKLSEAGGGVLELEKGEYHLYAENALQMSFFVSNHEQPIIQPVQIPLVDLRNVEIKGNGSTFILHGESLGVLLMDCENVTLSDIKIDYARSIFSEAKVVAFRNGKTIVEIDEKQFPYEVRGGKLFFNDGKKERGVSVVTAFRKDSKQIVERTSDIGFDGSVEKLPDGRIALRKDFSRVGAGVAVGDTLTLRRFERPHPACVLYRAKNTTFSDVVIHSSYGMALLAQRSENVKFVGTSDALAKTAGIFPREKTGRVYSASADATHFSNVAGKVIVENAFFETMMDDAINVHSTCLQIESISARNQLLCRFKHPQAIGFEVFMPGETLRFIKGVTLEQGEEVKIAAVQKLSPTALLVTLEKDIPEGFGVGDAVENADYQPEVVFRGNQVQNNRARGALFTTPKKVLVENNVFKNVSGSAILLAGDAQGWFESGPCEDMVIRKNKFINNLTSRFQFTNAIIAIYPEVKNLEAQEKFYHRNIIIEDNDFDTFDVPLLFAISTQNLVFRNNKIHYNNDFMGWGQKAFQFRRCSDVFIYGNKFSRRAMIHERLRSQERKSVGRTPDGSEARQGFTPKGVRATDCSFEQSPMDCEPGDCVPEGNKFVPTKEVSLEDCALEMTAPEEIHFAPRILQESRSLRDHVPQERRSPNCIPEGSEPSGSASEGVQFENCSKEQSRRDYAAEIVFPNDSEETKVLWF